MEEEFYGYKGSYDESFVGQLSTQEIVDSMNSMDLTCLRLSSEIVAIRHVVVEQLGLMSADVFDAICDRQSAILLN